MRGLLQRFIRPKNLTLDQFSERLRVGFGIGSKAGVAVNEGTAMRIATVWRCQRILTEAVAGSPLESRELIGPKSSLLVPDHPVGKVLRRPNPEQTPYQFKEFAMMRMLNRGNAYYRILWMNNGRPGQLWPITGSVNPVRPETRGPIVYEIMSPDKPEGQQSVSEVLDAEDVLHIPALAFNGLVGMNPIEKAREIFGLAIATEEHGSRTLANGATPAGIITYPGTMKDTYKKEFKQEWRDAFGGVQKTGETAVMEKGMTYQAIGVNNKDSQFLESRQFQGQEICRFYGVPPHMAGFRENQPRANMEQLATEFVDFSLSPWNFRFTESTMLQLFLERDFDRGMFLRFDVSRLLRADFKTRMEGYGIGVNWGILNPDEARGEEGKNPIEGGIGATHWRPGNMIPLENTDTMVEQGPGSQRGVRQDRSSRERAMVRDVARRVMGRAAGSLKKLEKGTISLEDVDKQYGKLAKFAADAFHISQEMAERATHSYAIAARMAVERDRVGQLIEAFEADDGAELAREVLNET